MNYEEYKATVLQRENKGYNDIRTRFTDSNIRLLHGVIGLNTEVGEIVDTSVFTGIAPKELTISFSDKVNLLEELGDAWFYLTLCFDTLGINFDELYEEVIRFRKFFSIDEIILEMQQDSYTLLDMTKKIVFYGKDIDSSFFREKLSNMLFYLCEIGFENEFDLEKIWTTNDKKLNARYGQKFTEQNALNRDLAIERQTLESN